MTYQELQAAIGPKQAPAKYKILQRVAAALNTKTVDCNIIGNKKKSTLWDACHEEIQYWTLVVEPE